MTIGRFAYWTRLANALSITRRELNWAAIVAGLIILLTFVPYIYGWAITPAGMTYAGYVYENRDHPVHSSWVRQAQMGKWLFEDLFTTEPQTPSFFNMYFLLVGNLARVAHLPLIAAEQLGRAFFSWAFFIVAYAFAAQFTQSVFTRRLSLLLMGFSSGLGWLVNPRIAADAAGLPPATWAMDYVPTGRGLILPEAITFPSVMIFGLFAVAYFLLATTFYLLWLAWQRGSWKLAAWAGVAAMALANVHSYDIITVWAVGAVALVIMGVQRRRLPGREVGMFALVAALSALPTVYQYHLFEISQVFRDKANTPTWSPPAFDEAVGRQATDYLVGELHYVLTFGLCAFAALVAIIRGVRQRNPGWLYLAAWALTPFVLVYLPFRFQRRIAEGWHVPLSILAALAIGDMLLAPRLAPGKKGKGRVAVEVSPARRWGVAGLFLLLTVPSNVGMVRLTLTGLRDDRDYRVFRVANPCAGVTDLNNRDIYPSNYLQTDDVNAMQWLAAHSKPKDAVLCLPAAGAYLPQVAGRHAYCAHWAETIDFKQKLSQVLRFFGNGVAAPSGETQEPMTDAERIGLARENGLTYLYYGAAERGVSVISPQQMSFLEPVYRNPAVEIYRFVADR